MSVEPATRSAHEAALGGPRGSVLIAEPSADLPLASLTVTLRTGSAADPAGLEGLGAFAVDLARRGAAGLTRAELDAAFEGLGASLDLSVDHDSIALDLEVLSRHLDEAVALLARVLLCPDLPASEAGQLRRENLAALDELRDDDAALASRFFQGQLFPAHPYGRPRYGTSASMARHTAEDARAWLERALAGANLIFAAAGDLDEDRLRGLLERRFGAVRIEALPAPPPPDPDLPPGLRLRIVDKPERSQSQILIGQPAPRWTDPDHLALSVAACAFGGTFTARLMNEVRVKRGLSYGASARLGQGRGGRGLVVNVFPSLAQTAETLALVLRLWEEWVERGITDEELEFSKEHLASAFAFHVATPEDRAELRTSVELCGHRPDYARWKPAALRALDADTVRAAMRRRLRPRDLAITVVSTASELRPRLKRAGLRFDSTEIRSFDAL